MNSNYVFKIQKRVANEIENVGCKEYFSSRGTVSTWWREDKWPYVRKLYYNEQVNYVGTFCEWRGKTVLDAGTGFGRFARALALKGANVTGLDINPDQIEIACSRNKNPTSTVGFSIGDVENLGFQDEVFDAVVCMETLMHIPNPSKAVAEFTRVVRPGGLIFLGINNPFSAPYLVRAIQPQRKLYYWLKHIPSIHHTNRICELRSWVSNSRLKVLDEIGIGLIHPDINIAIAPGTVVNLVPYTISKRFLSFEKIYDLGRTWLNHFMKAIIIVGEKSKTN